MELAPFSEPLTKGQFAYERIARLQSDMLKWAMKKGNSTSFRTNPGLGLDLLREFVNINEGTMRICTGNVLYLLNKGKERYIHLNKTFHGTIFEMDIIPDSSIYFFNGRQNNNDYSS